MSAAVKVVTFSEKLIATCSGLVLVCVPVAFAETTVVRGLVVSYRKIRELDAAFWFVAWSVATEWGTAMLKNSISIAGTSVRL